VLSDGKSESASKLCSSFQFGNSATIHGWKILSRTEETNTPVSVSATSKALKKEVSVQKTTNFRNTKGGVFVFCETTKGAN
jgi:hypothetical protein